MVLQDADKVIDKFVGKLTITPRGKKDAPHESASKEVKALFKQNIKRVIAESSKRQFVFKYTEDGDWCQHSPDLFAPMETLPSVMDTKYHLPSGSSMIVIKDDNGELGAWINLN